MSDSQQSKKPRTPAQQAAFKRCLEARQANMQKKLTQSDQVDDTSVPESQHEVQLSAPAPPVVSQPIQASTQVPAPPLADEQDDDEYIEFDPEDVYSVMNSYRGEIDELRQHITELKGGHAAFENHMQQQQQQTNSNKWALHFV
jgi:hypothetical protein